MIAAIFSIIVFAIFTVILVLKWFVEFFVEISSDLIGLTIIWWVLLIILNNTLWNF